MRRSAAAERGAEKEGQSDKIGKMDV